MSPRPELVAEVHSLFLPLVDPLDEGPFVARFLRSGGRAIALGMTGDEYSAREMSERRRSIESREWLSETVARWCALAGSGLLVAADFEVDGVNRLHDLVPTLSGARSEVEFRATADAAFESIAALGVTMTLGPVLDVLTGENRWLEGRAVRTAAEKMISRAAIVVEASERVNVLVAPKHFPGYPELHGDPAAEETEVVLPADGVEAGLAVFRAVLPSARAVMVGPAPVRALDPGVPPATSWVLHRLLAETGFRGLVVTDELTAASTLRGKPLGEVCVEAIKAGCHLLMVPGDDRVFEAADHVISAVAQGSVSEDAVAEAAVRVRRAAETGLAH